VLVAQRNAGQNQIPMPSRKTATREQPKYVSPRKMQRTFYLPTELTTR